MTYARRADTTQQPIMDGIRACGYQVWMIREPTDLLVRHPSWPQNMFCLGEAKTPNRVGGRYAPRSDQKDQQQFCREHGVPYWPSVDDALHYLRVFSAQHGPQFP